MKSEGTKKDSRLAKFEQKIDAAMASAEPSKEAIFAEIFPKIREALERGMPRRQLITLINETYRLKLHMASFRSLYDNALANVQPVQEADL